MCHITHCTLVVQSASYLPGSDIKGWTSFGECVLYPQCCTLTTSINDIHCFHFDVDIRSIHSPELPRQQHKILWPRHQKQEVVHFCSCQFQNFIKHDHETMRYVNDVNVSPAGFILLLLIWSPLTCCFFQFLNIDIVITII